MVLPDILKLGLKVVFCGTAVGDESTRVGAYYAGRGNKFWKVLFRIGLTPRLLDPHEFRTLPEYGIGLTDLVKTRSGSDASISSSDFDVASFHSKIKRLAPIVVAFNGKRAAQEFLDRPVAFGQQPEKIGQTLIFVLPSTSGAAARHWDETPWIELADFVGQ